METFTSRENLLILCITVSQILFIIQHNNEGKIHNILIHTNTIVFCNIHKSIPQLVYKIVVTLTRQYLSCYLPRDGLKFIFNHGLSTYLEP